MLEQRRLAHAGRADEQQGHVLPALGGLHGLIEGRQKA
jgi:hypothetical protein